MKYTYKKERINHGFIHKN
uniref:Uncharacterized protein n=1 Tax=Arundo donax TaxID=35708 RepID=A0A0A9ATA6_ARUDO